MRCVQGPKLKHTVALHIDPLLSLTHRELYLCDQHLEDRHIPKELPNTLAHEVYFICIVLGLGANTPFGCIMASVFAPKPKYSIKIAASIKLIPGALLTLEPQRLTVHHVLREMSCSPPLELENI